MNSPVYEGRLEQKIRKFGKLQYWIFVFGFAPRALALFGA
jgi:hypothetical protein